MICATGFQRGFEHDALLARLVAEHGLETVDGWIVLGSGGWSDDLKVWALCVPTDDIPVQVTDIDN